MEMKETLFERTGGTYRKEGDYLLPNVAAPEQPPLDLSVGGTTPISESTIKYFSAVCGFRAS